MGQDVDCRLLYSELSVNSNSLATIKTLIKTSFLLDGLD